MATPGGVALGLLGSAASEAAAFAAGFALGPTMAPEVEFLRNEAWNAVQTRMLDPQVAAEIAAENVAKYDDMAQQAAYHGIAAPLFADLYGVSLTAPGMGELLQMARRQTINPGNFLHGLRKAKLEPMWNDALVDLQKVYLSPDILAVMLQRNVIPNQGQLPGVTLSTAGKVPRFPHVPIDAYAMAKTFGWSQAQLDAQTRIQGLPPGMDLVARMVFRQILDRGDFTLAAEQSNRRVEWADFEFEGYRDIPTSHDAVQYQLRGFTDRAGRLALTRLHGMADANSDVLYDIAGRAPSARQVYLGLARGAKYPSTYADVPEPYRSAIERSDIRPEFADIVFQNRFGEPSAFVVRALLRDGAISADRGATILENSGIPPDLAVLVANFYAAAGGTTADPHIGKAENQLWTTTHRSYVAREITDADATSAIEAAGVAAASVPAVLTLWSHERSLIRKQLTPAQVKKALRDGIYTQQVAMTALLDRGYDQAEATVLLQE